MYVYKSYTIEQNILACELYSVFMESVEMEAAFPFVFSPFCPCVFFCSHIKVLFPLMTQ